MTAVVAKRPQLFKYPDQCQVFASSFAFIRQDEYSKPKFPARVARSAAGSIVARVSIKATACSAPDRALVSGVFTTAMPACVASRTATKHVVGWLMPIYRKGWLWPTDWTFMDTDRQPPLFCAPGAVANACSRCWRILAEAWLKSLVAIASMIATCSRHQSWTRRLFA
ncbi:MAG: hypothetical protein JWR49_1754 [Tardiphaga sp.]|nr:hypothetical protein [Tardiphaga sp.]